MIKRYFSVLLLLLFACFMPISAIAQLSLNENIIVAQNNSPNLWDLLFGPQNKKSQPRQNTKKTTPRRVPSATTPVSVPAVLKSENATRLMVFGDSLAIDLAKGLERFYAQDLDLLIISKGVGSSGFVRDDFFDWSVALKTEIAADSFDIAVIIMGINDRQALLLNGESAKPLSDEWRIAYSKRIESFLAQLRSAEKPTIWLGMPPMASPKFSASIAQISSLQRLSAFAAGAEFIDIYERFTDDSGKYSSRGPDINGQQVQLRKSDGIHFSRAGSDKLAFFINVALKKFYRGGTISLAITDPLEGTDAQLLMRPPFQGLGQLRLLQVAGAILSLNNSDYRADDLLLRESAQKPILPFNFDEIGNAPLGRVDAFGDLSKETISINEEAN